MRGDRQQRVQIDAARMHHLLARRVFAADRFRRDRRGRRGGKARQQAGFVAAHRFGDPRALRHEAADDRHRVAARMCEECRLRAVEALRDRGQFMLERDRLVDRREAPGLRQMREPVAQRQRAGVRSLRGPRE
jgi:hypothetical protein